MNPSIPLVLKSANPGRRAQYSYFMQHPKHVYAKIQNPFQKSKSKIWVTLQVWFRPLGPCGTAPAATQGGWVQSCLALLDGPRGCSSGAFTRTIPLSEIPNPKANVQKHRLRSNPLLIHLDFFLLGAAWVPKGPVRLSATSQTRPKPKRN